MSAAIVTAPPARARSITLDRESGAEQAEEGRDRPDRGENREPPPEVGTELVPETVSSTLTASP